MHRFYSLSCWRRTKQYNPHAYYTTLNCVCMCVIVLCQKQYTIQRRGVRMYMVSPWQNFHSVKLRIWNDFRVVCLHYLYLLLFVNIIRQSRLNGVFGVTNSIYFRCRATAMILASTIFNMCRVRRGDVCAWRTETALALAIWWFKTNYALYQCDLDK